MVSGFVLVVIAAFQIALIVGMVWFLFITDGRMRVKDRSESIAPAQLRKPLREFLVQGGSCEAVAAVLTSLPPAVAARQLEWLATSLIPAEQMATLARRIRSDPWVTERLAGATSRRWWKRMEAARLVSIVCGASDRELLAKLVMDRHPAVAAAATAGIGPHADTALVEAVVRAIPRRSPTIRLQQMRELRRHAAVVTPLLVAALKGPLPVADLQVMIQLAEAIGTPSALSAIVRLHRHSNPVVRSYVARALRAAFVPGAVDAARALLRDQDWRVRAAAARALEGLHVSAVVPELGAALGDVEWWVRFRAGVALAGLGETGRAELQRVAAANDPFASEMAISVSGLSAANRLDLGG